MLTLSHLANLIALLFGERPETMQLIARNLRQARLVASAGRGRGGARQEPRHVANMLIAACTVDQVSDVAGAVGTFASLEVIGDRPATRRSGLGAPTPKELLFATRKGVQLGGVLSAFVEMAANGQLYSLLMAHAQEFVDRELLRAGADAIRRAPRGSRPTATAEFAAKMASHVQLLIDQSVVYLTISFERPLPSGRMEFGTRLNGEANPLLAVDFELPPPFIASPRNAQRRNAWSRIDRLQRVTISHRTLLSIGQAIAAEQEI